MSNWKVDQIQELIGDIAGIISWSPKWDGYLESARAWTVCFFNKKRNTVKTGLAIVATFSGGENQCPRSIHHRVDVLIPHIDGGFAHTDQDVLADIFENYILEKGIIKKDLMC